MDLQGVKKSMVKQMESRKIFNGAFEYNISCCLVFVEGYTTRLHTVAHAANTYTHTRTHPLDHATTETHTSTHIRTHPHSHLKATAHLLIQRLTHPHIHTSIPTHTRTHGQNNPSLAPHVYCRSPAQPCTNLLVLIIHTHIARNNTRCDKFCLKAE